MAEVTSVSHWFPKKKLTNEDLKNEFPEWNPSKIFGKVGIEERRISSDDEYSSDLAVNAATKLFMEHDLDPQLVDVLILVTQTPDYLLPTTACIVHERLGLRESSAAFDVNMGCSGYIYGLSLASALIDSGQAKKVLLITADTYSKLLNRADKSLRSIFGDAASATLISSSPKKSISNFVFGTDGSGAGNLIAPHGALRNGNHSFPEASPLARGIETNGFDLYMNGPEIFNFTIRVVQPAVEKLLKEANLEIADVDQFIFHQANSYMLGHLIDKMGIDPLKAPIFMKDCGNTVSSSIPIVLSELISTGKIEPGQKIVLVGFGVGLSWAACLLDWV